MRKAPFSIIAIIVLTLTLNTFAALKAPLEPPTKPGDGKPWTQAQSDDARAKGNIWKAATELYRASEFSMDVYGAASIDDIEHLEDHVAGYGIGFNYFFTRNFGLGFEARTTLVHDETWLNRENLLAIWRVPVGAFNFYGFGGAGIRYQDHNVEPRFFAGGGVGYRFNGNLEAFTDVRIETEEFKDREPLLFRLGVKIAL